MNSLGISLKLKNSNILKICLKPFWVKKHDTVNCFDELPLLYKHLGLFDEAHFWL